MSQYGMQMPAGQLQRGATMNIYTGLLFAAVIALLAACVYVYVQGSVIGPSADGHAAGNPLAIHGSPDSPNAKNKFPDQVKLGD